MATGLGETQFLPPHTVVIRSFFLEWLYEKTHGRASDRLPLQGSDAASLDAASIATADEVVLELRRRLCASDGAVPSGASSSSAAGPADPRRTTAAAADSPAARLECSGEALDDACILRCRVYIMQMVSSQRKNYSAGKFDTLTVEMSRVRF